MIDKINRNTDQFKRNKTQNYRNCLVDFALLKMIIE